MESQVFARNYVSYGQAPVLHASEEAIVQIHICFEHHVAPAHSIGRELPDALHDWDCFMYATHEPYHLSRWAPGF